MKTYLALFFSMSSLGWAFAQIPPGYYNTATGKTGESLKIALHDIIDNHTVYNYSTLWGLFPTTDDNGSGKVWDIYSDNPSGTTAYYFNFGSDQCGTYSNEGDCYNREHTLPKSWFNDQPPMNSDIFHVFPTDGFVNNMRGNLPLGEVGSASTTSSNGSKTGNSNYPGYSGNVFEPIDDFKGDMARVYFYMMTRYKDEISSWSSDMFQGNDLSSWAENMLLDWHLNDPVSTKEIDRNNEIYGLQGNRNPFVDHPHWVEYIWGPIASDGSSEINIGLQWYGGQLKIDHPESLFNIHVFDLSGQLLIQEQTSSNTWRPNTGLNSGIYLIQVSTEEKIQHIKITI